MPLKAKQVCKGITAIADDAVGRNDQRYRHLGECDRPLYFHHYFHNKIDPDDPVGASKSWCVTAEKLLFAFAVMQCLRQINSAQAVMGAL